MDRLKNADAWIIGTICASRVGAEKAVREFCECIENGRTQLDLSSCGLISLPPEIGQLTSLKWFSCDNNQLTELPPEIGQLTSLEVLSCHNNQLTELPPEIGQLNSLKNLWCNNNQLPSDFNGNLTIEQKLALIEKYFRRGRLTKAAR